MPKLNRDLWEASGALSRLTQRDLPTVSIAFRLALTTNHLRPILEAMEKARLALVEQHNVSPEAIRSDPDQQAAIARGKAFQVDFDALMNQEVDWQCPATIPAKRFHAVKELPAGDLAPLIRIGVIVEPEGLDEPEKKG